MFDFLTSTTRERSFDFQVLTQYAIKKIYKTKHFLKPISATLSMEFRILSTSFFIIFSLIFPQISTGEDRLIAGESIRGNKTIVSAGEIFALGFFSPRNSTNRYIGIWYNKISEFTVVWVANKEDPITDATSNFTINHDGNLVLFDGRKNIVWSSNVSSVVGNRNITAVLLDTGNLELRSSNQTVLWQSFDHPFGSVLPGAKFYLNLKTGQSIRARSWTSADDPTPGTFSAGIDPRTPRQLLVSNGSIKYWRENVWYKELSASKPESDRNYIVYLSVLVYPNEIFYITSLSDNSIMARYVLIPTGQIQLQSWRQNSEKWNVLWSSKVNKCDVYARCGPSASCDYNSSTSACICLHGFKPRNEKDWEKGNWSGGCVREKALKCGERDGFATFEKTKLPDFSISFRNMSVNECEMKCLANCSCTAYAYTNGTGWVAANCLIWTGDLIDLVSSYGKLNLYVRLDASELGASGTSGFSIKKRHVVLIIISSVVAAGLLLLGFSAYFIRKRLKKDGESEPNPRYPASDLMVYKALASGKELPLFNFSSIVAATDNFSLSNKLGEGGFGPVYKGRLLGGEEVAVKRLSKTSGQGLEEFKNEVELIAKLQHRNLVRLLGWCVHGDDMILIYEFMPNKSLDKFIFETTQGTLLNWTTRFSIIQGIAQGLLYLHRHSRLRIIHRDLKSSNILLDETMNPKISDFGLARIFEGNQSQENTKRVVGTYGYMSPEYALDGHFSEKSDVFSFGVLLLEILSGKKNTGFYPYKQSVNLLGYAWELWREGRGLELIDPLIREPCATNEVMRSIHVSLLCVQENPSDRPSMSSVILLLGNESTDPPTPKQPAFSNMGFSISMDPSCSVSINNTINEASNNNSINGA